MVGFGSSLRMSRRRGWEEAYLDYASLRLLLTQIEAVYEEEDWKRGGSSTQNLTDMDEMERFDDGIVLDGGDDNNTANMIGDNDSDEEIEDGSDNDFSGALGNVWRKTQRAVLGQKSATASSRDQRRKRRNRRQHRRKSKRNNQQFHRDGTDTVENVNDYWAMAGAETNRDRSHRRGRGTGEHNTKGAGDGSATKESSDFRALDKGGWRSPGVTDYRDELFLESDDSRAFGYYDDEDDNEWEDEDSVIDEIEEQDQYYGYGGDGYYNAGYGTLDGSGRFDETFIDDGHNLSLPYHQVGPNSHNNEGSFLCNSPNRDNSNESGYFNMPHGILDTPIGGQHDTNFQSDSPGVLEASHDVCNDASGRKDNTVSGFNHDCSPSERGWGFLDFIPNFFASRQKSTARETDSAKILNNEKDFLNSSSHKQHRHDDSMDGISPHPSRGSSQSNYAAISDSPNHYTHFSETMQSKTIPPPPPAPTFAVGDIATSQQLKYRSEPNLSPLFERSETTSVSCPSEINSLITTPSASTVNEDLGSSNQHSYTYLASPSFNTPVSRKKTLKSPHPVPATTAIGMTMPMTPMTPLSPVVESGAIDASMEEFNRSVEGFFLNANNGIGDGFTSPNGIETRNGASSSGFGVTIKTAPTRSNNYLFMPPNNSNDNIMGDNFGGDMDGSAGVNLSETTALISPSWNHHDRPPLSPNRRNLRTIIGRSQFQYPANSNDNPGRVRLPSLSSVRSKSIDDGGTFIMNLFFGRHESTDSRKQCTDDMTDTNMASNTIASQRHLSAEHIPIAVNGPPAQNDLLADQKTDVLQRRANAASKRRTRVQLKKQRHRRRRKVLVPLHLRTAHARAAAITERFRGLLRAEVEKVILFANSRLGELSDTIGSLRFASFEDDHEELRRKYPNLADSGMHPASSSDDDEGCDESCDSSSSDGNNRNQDEEVANNRRRSRALNSDSSNEKDATTRRQINLRDRLRISRPMFQKADFLGEDFSLLSAVDEADAYTAIGVELMHLLKFVCINIIATRKICKKHDRLLANRMLGDYYYRQIRDQHRKQDTGAKRSQQQKHGLIPWNEPQFGGALSNHSLQDTGGYILGIFDTKIQHLANSTTMQTVSSSLAIALADFESSQALSSRLGRLDNIAENASTSPNLTRNAEVLSPRRDVFASSRLREVVTNQISGNCFRVDDDSTVSQECGDQENASAASNISLTRLQYVVTSVFGLREAARIKSTPFEHYASRLFMTSTGGNITGDGLDGCSRETLDFLTSYNPDVAYQINAETIDSCLKMGHQQDGDGIGGVMVASLAAAASDRGDAANIARFRRRVSAAMSIKPQATGEESTGAPARNIEYRNILRLNAASMLLYSANYYVVVPSAHIFSVTLGARSSLSTTLIGVTNITAVISSLLQSMFISKRNSFVKRQTNVADFRLPLVVSTICPLVGNVLYSYALAYPSVAMAVIGRLLVGFGCSEVLNRQLLLVTVPPESINIEVSRLVKKSLICTAISLFVGALFDIHVKDKVAEFSVLIHAESDEVKVPLLSDTFPSMTPVSSNETFVSNDTTLDPIVKTQPLLPPLPLNQFTQGVPFGEHSFIQLEFVGYCMAFLWFIHLVALLFFYDLPKASQNAFENEALTYPLKGKGRGEIDEDFDSDSVASNNAGVINAFGSPANNPFMSGGMIHENSNHGDRTFEKLQTMSRSTVKQLRSHHHSHWESIIGVRRLMFSNVAFPVSMALLFLAKFTSEVLLSSCATITSRYFNWSGARAGFFMGIMSSMILPINISLSLEKNCTERSTIKTALAMARYGLAFMINYEAIFFLIYDIVKRIKKWEVSTKYDWFFGAPQYLFSFAIIFIGVIYLESATLTLMSKVAPVRLKKYAIDNVFVVVVISSLGRLTGDMLISAVDLSSWIFCNDIVNSLCFFLIVAFAVGSYFVRKHFFFLI